MRLEFEDLKTFTTRKIAAGIVRHARRDVKGKIDVRRESLKSILNRGEIGTDVGLEEIRNYFTANGLDHGFLASHESRILDYTIYQLAEKIYESIEDSVNRRVAQNG